MKTTARAVAFCYLIAFLLLAGGCVGSNERVGEWFGPAEAAEIKVVPLTNLDASAKLLETQHYKIYTTIDDDEICNRLGQLMEGSLQAYHMLVPSVQLTSDSFLPGGNEKPVMIAPGLTQIPYPMECYVFSRRAQWAEFTVEKTGSMAPVYLKINRGGYAIGDRYVAYYIGENSTFSVTAHEGWHQFCGRYMVGRLPPFLEEGLATMFEGVRFRNDLPLFNLSINQNRAIALRSSIDNNDLWPLDEVIGLNAGQVLDKPGAMIESFYAQAWGLGRFLWDGDNCAHRPALQKLLADCAAGHIYDPTSRRHTRLVGWTSAGAKAMLEHYLGMSFDDINADYTRFIHHIADDELPNETVEPW